MSKRSQRGFGQQQPAANQQQDTNNSVEAPQQQQQPHNANQDDQKRTMTSQQQQQQARKRPRQQVNELEADSNRHQELLVEQKLDKLLEQQEMIDYANEVVQEQCNVSSLRQRRPNQPLPADLEHFQAEQTPQLQQQRSSQRLLPPPTVAQVAGVNQNRKSGETNPQTGANRPRNSARPLTAANTSSNNTSQCKQQQNICAACHKPIRERYLLMALDKHWHEDCLKCACCDCRLGEVGSSLFTHSDKILCRRDFLRIFGQHGNCAACKRSIPPYEMVMRANELAYHMDCFACQQCQYRFCVGDQFHLTEAHKIICRSCHSERPTTGQQQQQQPVQFQQPTNGIQLSDSSGGAGASGASPIAPAGNRLQEQVVGSQLAETMTTNEAHNSDQDQDNNHNGDEEGQQSEEVVTSGAVSQTQAQQQPLAQPPPPPPHQTGKQKQACAV